MKAGDRKSMDPGAKVITGPLHTENKGAADWGYQGFIAYGCHDFVVVVDPNTLQVIQTLGPSPATVTHVRWMREKYHHAFATGSTYSLILVTADVSGALIVWDVVTGLKKCEFTGPSPIRTVSVMEWYAGHDASHDLLMVLRCPDVLELWDAYSGVALWRKTIGESVQTFSLDPFGIHRMVLLSEAPRLLVVAGINVTEAPNDQTIEGLPFNDPNPSLSSESKDKRRSSMGSEKSPTIKSSNSWTKMATNLASNILNVPETVTKRLSITGDEAVTLTSCVQATFSAVHRHIVLLVFPSAVHLVDVDVGLTIGEVRLDRASPRFLKVLVPSSTDMLFCFHDNGSSSIRMARSSKDKGLTMEMNYDQVCQSEAVRLLRQTRLIAFLLQPITENKLGIVLSDGRLIILDILAMEYFKSSSDCNAPSTRSISDVLYGRNVALSGRPRVFMDNQIALRVVISGLVSGLTATTTKIEMNPGNTVLAIGSDCGVVQLLMILSGQVTSEYTLFMTPIRGLVWLRPDLILAYTYPDPPTYGNRVVKSSFIAICIRSGATMIEQRDKPGIIVTACVSAFRDMFAVVYEDRPIELWSIISGKQLREIELPSGTQITAATFYPAETKVRYKPEITSQPTADDEVEERPIRPEQLFAYESSSNGIIRYGIYGDGKVHRKAFQSGELLGAQAARIVSICWKNKCLVVCDTSGAVHMVYAKFRYFEVRKLQHRIGMVAGRIQFCSTSMKFLVLYPGFCVDIFEVVNGKGVLLGSSPTLTSNPVDAVWVSSNCVAIATETTSVHLIDISKLSSTSPQYDEGFLIVKDSEIHSTNTPVKNWAPHVVSCPRLLERKDAFLLKYHLQCGREPASQTVSKFKHFLQLGIFDDSQDRIATIADRCFEVARLFGDEFDLDFWRLVKYVIPNHRKDLTVMPDLDEPFKLVDLFSTIQEQAYANNCLIDFSDEGSKNEPARSEGRTDSSCPTFITPDIYLATPLNILLTSHEYTVYEMSRLSLHNRRRKDNERVKRLCASRFITQNQTDQAVKILMETDAESSSFRIDWLKACLSCCLKSDDNSSISTIKLAATHMIAAGNITDGVELLCMINKHLDACKYLISQGKWMDAVWIAKTKLCREDCMKVMCKYAEHLWNNFQKDKAVLVILSLGQYAAASRMLCELGHYDTAALFLLFCLQHKLIDSSPAIDKVLVQFAKLLTVAGYQSAIEWVCGLAGSHGQSYLKDLNNSANSC